MSAEKRKKKSFTLLILLGVLALFCILLAVVLQKNTETRIKESQKSASEEARNVVSILSDNNSGVAGISYTKTSSGNTVVFELAEEDGKYNMKDDPSFKVNNSMVSELVESVVSLKSTKIVSESPDNISEYGIDKPSYEVKISYKDGFSEVLLIGDKNVYNSGYYAMKKDGDTVYMISSSLPMQLDKEKGEYLEKETQTETESETGA